MSTIQRDASTTAATSGRILARQGFTLFKFRQGFTLLELLLTIAIMSILAAAIIPQLTSDLPERLDAAAQVVSADLDYARSLAVANDSTYQILFQPATNRYYLQHTGVNTLLNVLPRMPFRQNDDPPTQQTTKLGDLPIPEPGVRLVGAVVMQGAGQTATNVEFNALGSTTSKYETVVWLVCGTGTSVRYISVHVNPVTGLSEIGSLQTALPTAVASTLGQGGS